MQPRGNIPRRSDENPKGSVTQPHRLFEHRIEHRREVARRRIDDLQHLGGGGLLLQCLECELLLQKGPFVGLPLFGQERQIPAAIVSNATTIEMRPAMAAASTWPCDQTNMFIPSPSI